MKQKWIVFVLALVFSLSVPATVYAQDYGREFPNYVNYSGGAYIEIQSTVGRGTVVFQDTYKTGYLGFYGSGYNICNLSKTTISGYFITASGKEYDCRISSYGVIQYYYTSGTTREYRDLEPTQIYNTNVEFIDETERNRDNVLDLYDSSAFNYTVIGLDIACVLLLGVLIIKVGKI